MNDNDVLRRIRELMDEEHRLRHDVTGEGLDRDGGSRLKDLEQALDQCWDLLRQRRARRESGQDPDAADARPRSEVEGYLQ
ncbi:DUF2630 family protein [Saccharothrix obliqua]|uniref:DUF2630 family protein n=1 Tax=Saccharothrix obliqua TaxID=2861747 RepID=UPI001C5EC40A|nr:DUF2630 family protein [Saccharothrix obliqua]MBW4718041.1 DUF2630 family protein [Saccharothrix obliqua]